MGLAVALGCGEECELLVTDQQEMLELMETNIRLNKLEGRAKALVLNWYALSLLRDFKAPSEA